MCTSLHPSFNLTELYKKRCKKKCILDETEDYFQQWKACSLYTQLLGLEEACENTAACALQASVSIVVQERSVLQGDLKRQGHVKLDSSYQFYRLKGLCSLSLLKSDIQVFVRAFCPWDSCFESRASAACVSDL